MVQAKPGLNAGLMWTLNIKAIQRMTGSAAITDKVLLGDKVAKSLHIKNHEGINRGGI